MPEIFEFMQISRRLFFFCLTKKRSKKSQDAAIPALLAQFLRLRDSTSRCAKIGSPPLYTAQRHSSPAVKNEIDAAKAIKSVKKGRSLGGVLAFDSWSRAMREIALAISRLFEHFFGNEKSVKKLKIYFLRDA
jgi:hypothetical protein